MGTTLAIIHEHMERMDSRLLTGIQVILGSLYIAILAQVEIPLQPVPVTLHTFAVITLALYLGKNKAAVSLILYLAEATCGLPVFPGLWSDPLWMLHPTAGYIAAFPFAAYLIGHLAQNGQAGMLRLLGGIFAGKAIIYFFGVLWLSHFVGFPEALILGLYPFVYVGLLKVAAAVSMKMATRTLRSAFHF